MAPLHFVIRSLPEFFQKLLDFTDYQGDYWYRGQKDHNYSLLPSAYRPKNLGQFVDHGPQLEKDQIAKARSSLFDNPKTNFLKNELDWLCFLQHVGTPTRLLDFTLSPAIALYFAFSNYLNKDAPFQNRLPSVWILNLNELSKATKNKIKQELNDFSCNEKKRTSKSQSTDSDDIKSLITFFADHSKSSSEITLWEEKSRPTREKLNNLHIPFLSPPVHERPKAQGGCFIRFPLYKRWEYEKYQKTALEKTYNKHNFLAQYTFINPRQLAKELAIFNLDISRIYPDEMNIAKWIKKITYQR